MAGETSRTITVNVQGDSQAEADEDCRVVMSGVNPQGCQMFSFKHPCAAELRHDFLWRTMRDLSECGREWRAIHMQLAP